MSITVTVVMTKTSQSALHAGLPLSAASHTLSTQPSCYSSTAHVIAETGAARHSCYAYRCFLAPVMYNVQFLYR